MFRPPLIYIMAHFTLSVGGYVTPGTDSRLPNLEIAIEILNDIGVINIIQCHHYPAIIYNVSMIPIIRNTDFNLPKLSSPIPFILSVICYFIIVTRDNDLIPLSYREIGYRIHTI